MLAQSPVATDLAGVMRSQGADPETSSWGAIGYTTNPVNAQAPDYTVTYTERDGGHLARLQITRHPSEGDNVSVYLTAGTYETNLSLNREAFTEFHDEFMAGTYLMDQFLVPFGSSAVQDQPPNRVFLVMKPNMAQSNQAAEQEHCNDHRYAYQQSLGIIFAALQAVADRDYGPAATNDGALALLTEDLLRHIPAGRRPLGVDVGRWLDEYARLSRMSKKRDEEDWHRFGLQTVSQPAGPVTNLPGEPRPPVTPFYLEITPGRTQIGTHPSDSVIV